MGNFIDLAGKKFGKLKVENFYHRKKGIIYWLCKCECGNKAIISGSHLRKGHTKSCGCLKKHNISIITHNMSKTPFWRKWESLRQRCNNKNCTSYKYYGNRGIKVSGEWSVFVNFKNDMLVSYKKHARVHGEKNTSLDRVNSNGNYCKENCRWTTLREQARNTRRNHLIYHNGKTKCLSYWADYYGINVDTLYYRINIGKWTAEKALTTPVKKNR